MVLIARRRGKLEKGGLITSVEAGSPAQRAGVLAGERLLAINDAPVSDLIDYLILSAELRFSLSLYGPEGYRTVELQKTDEESPGLGFAEAVFDGIRRCGNHCVFCFVDQLPPGLRATLYIKDEDYRLSFLQGNYVTLTNLSEADLRRIMSYRLSPLYLSVHATDPEVRGRLLGLNHEVPVLPVLERLTAAGIRIQAQVVACPGWNDGQVLDRTIANLAALAPGVESLAVVPVGLTAHRGGLRSLVPYNRASARQLLAQIEHWQKKLLPDLGGRFVFAADEFFVLAGLPWPAAAEYEDYPQLENGVGLLRSFEDEFRLAWRRWRGKIPPGTLRVVTGQSAADMWTRLARLVRPAGIDLAILPVINRFFGSSVTVAGLLTGRDIVSALEGAAPMPTFVPRIALQRGADLFLDGMTLSELSQSTKAEVVETDASQFLPRIARALSNV